MPKSGFAVPKPRTIKLSADGKNASNKTDNEEKETLKEYVVRQVSDMVSSLIPDSIKELPGEYVMWAGSLALLVMGTMFFYFVVMGTKINLSSKFISLDETSGNCLRVTKEITGQVPYYASSDGYWLGEPGFQYNKVQYYLTLNKFSADSAQYEEMVSGIVIYY